MRRYGELTKLFRAQVQDHSKFDKIQRSCGTPSFYELMFDAQQASSDHHLERRIIMSVRRFGLNRVLIAVDPEDLAKHYRDGVSLDDLGILCGCSGKRIRHILVAQGVESRPRGYNSDCRPNKFMRC